MTSLTSNIDLFHASTALIFSELYKNMPVPITFNYQQLSSQLIQLDDSVTPEKITEVFINTVTWLKKSGFIWLDSESERDVYGALLSPKGLNVLTMVSEASIAEESIGERLVSSENTCSNEEKATLIKLALSAGCHIASLDK